MLSLYQFLNFCKQGDKENSKKTLNANKDST